MLQEFVTIKGISMIGGQAILVDKGALCLF
jgi:hypothetical protein